MNKRIESLDYLRGLMALSVMVYHYGIWAGCELGADTLLGKLGIYAVSVFYILSGISLSIVYLNSEKVFSTSEFYIRRSFRILPLFWLSVTFTLILKFGNSIISGESFDTSIYKVIINYTLVFSFIDPSNYIAIGSWSIGNEIFFYALFPLIVISTAKFKKMLHLWLVLSLIVYLHFAFNLIDASRPIQENWYLYVNPLNQFFLFVVGVFIGTLKQTNPLKWQYFIASFAICVYIFFIFPINADDVELVSGLNRILFTLAILIIVTNVYFSRLEFPVAVRFPLKFLGECSYSIYLVHPIIAFPAVYLFTLLGIPALASYSICIIITLLIAYVSYNYFEKPLIKMGKKLT